MPQGMALQVNLILFMSGSLPELSPVEVYVMRQMRLADDFFIRQPAWQRKWPPLCNLCTK